MNKLFCGHCGTRLETDDKFCKNCGASVSDTQIKISEPVDAQESREVKEPAETDKTIELKDPLQPETPEATKARQEAEVKKQKIKSIIGNRNPDDLFGKNSRKKPLTYLKVKNDVRGVSFTAIILPWVLFFVFAVIEMALPTPITEIGMVIAMPVAIVNGIRFFVRSFRRFKVYEIKDGIDDVYVPANNKGGVYCMYRAAEYTPSPTLKIHPAKELEKIFEENKKREEK